MKDNIVYLDGAMGTILLNSVLTLGESPQLWNITNPKLIESIHHSYYEAGSNVVITNTFGANSLKFSDEELEKIICGIINLVI